MCIGQQRASGHNAELVPVTAGASQCWERHATAATCPAPRAMMGQLAHAGRVMLPPEANSSVHCQRMTGTASPQIWQTWQISNANLAISQSVNLKRKLHDSPSSKTTVSNLRRGVVV